jgi:hypothetical protein
LSALKTEESAHNSFKFSAVAVQVENASPLRTRKPLLVEKHFIVVTWAIEIGSEELAL